MADFGGTIIFRTPTGNIAVRGSVTHNPAAFSYEGGANYDGSIYRSAKPEGVRFALAFQNTTPAGVPVDIAALMALSDVTFTLIHATERVTRTYSAGALEGDPQVDDLTGEISGITGRASGLIETKN
jgi:hypothetical protein